MYLMLTLVPTAGFGSLLDVIIAGGVYYSSSATSQQGKTTHVLVLALANLVHTVRYGSSTTVVPGRVLRMNQCLLSSAHEIYIETITGVINILEQWRVKPNLKDLVFDPEDLFPLYVQYYSTTERGICGCTWYGTTVRVLK